MSVRGQHAARPRYKLREIKLPGKSEPEKGKYRAIVTDRGCYDTKKVIEEMLDYSSLRLSPYMVESVVNGVMESMIKQTLSDGITRKFGTDSGKPSGPYRRIKYKARGEGAL